MAPRRCSGVGDPGWVGWWRHPQGGEINGMRHDRLPDGTDDSSLSRRKLRRVTACPARHAEVDRRRERSRMGARRRELVGRVTPCAP